MPTTYAHDLFGKKIYAKLPAEIQKVIRRNTNLYRIGLHGPDILFYDISYGNRYRHAQRMCSTIL